MKTLYQDNLCKLVDNEHNYDFVGWIENFTDKTMVIIFLPGEYDFDEESGEDVWREDDWEIEELSFCDDKELEEKRAFVEENDSWPNFTTMVEIEPKKVGGFLADGTGRSMFNALRKHLEK